METRRPDDRDSPSGKPGLGVRETGTRRPGNGDSASGKPGLGVRETGTRRPGNGDSASGKPGLGVGETGTRGVGGRGSRHHRGVESTRVDRWLWAVRLTKTRPDAAAACRAGHVRVNDRPAKPSTTVSAGDEVRALVGDRTRIVQVVRVIQKRVGAADAVTCYLDRTPP